MKWPFSKAAQQEAKPKPRQDKRPRRRTENVVVRYFRQTWAELKKVNWPNRQETRNLTLMVLAATVAMSAFLGIADWLSSLFFSFLVKASG